MKRLKKVEEHIEHATWNAANAPKQIRTLEVEQQQRLTHKMSMKWHEDYRIEMQNISAYLLRATKILTNLVLQVRWRYSNREETKSILQSIVHSAESNHHSYGAHAYPFPRFHETTGREEEGRKEIFKIFQNSILSDFSFRSGFDRQPIRRDQYARQPFRFGEETQSHAISNGLQHHLRERRDTRSAWLLLLHH